MATEVLMRNPGLPTRLFAPLTSLVAALLLSGGCGDTSEVKEEKTYSLDVGGGGGDKDTGYNFGVKDTTTAQPGDVSDTLGADAGPATEDAKQFADAAQDDDTGQPDAGSGTISSCFGHCGIFLEENPCHCHHKCQLEGNCCKDFAAICACQGKADCDDGLFCTTDTCINNLCMQIPLPANKCCDADAQCAGGDACTAAQCVDGVCKLVPKDCDDGVECTIDLCAGDSGECSNDIHPNRCLIDGLCADAGDAKAGSDGCQTCQPKADPTAWQAKAGACFIDGQCVLAGENPKGSSGACRTCDPDTAGDAWTLITGTCFIDDKCYKSGAFHPLNPACALCSPSKSQTAWTGKPGKCAVNGVCYDDGAAAPGGATCAKCDATQNTSAFTIDKGACLVDGTCRKHGDLAEGSFGCQLCDASKAQLAWTVATGKDCTDDDACTVDTVCVADGTCKGKPKGACCKGDGDCAGNPVGDCEKSVCNAGIGECQTKAIEACCTSGVCCDIVNQTYHPSFTKCSNFPFGSKQYKCEGNVAMKRALYPGCEGKTPKCSQAFPAPGEWIEHKVCAKGTVCEFVAQTTPPNCK